jgi:hypothetical protein
MYTNGGVACCWSAPTAQQSCPLLGKQVGGRCLPCMLPKSSHKIHGLPVLSSCERLSTHSLSAPAWPACMQALIPRRLGSSGSCSAASSIHEKVASATGRPHAQTHMRKWRISASGPTAAAAAAAAQSATQSAAPLESDAAQYPVSAAVAAAAAAALAAGRNVLAAAAAVDRWTLALAACTFTGSSAVLAMLSAAAHAADPTALTMIGCGATAAAVGLLYLLGALARDSPRLAALQSAGRVLWTWQLAWHLTGASLPVGCCLPVSGLCQCVCAQCLCMQLCTTNSSALVLGPAQLLLVHTACRAQPRTISCIGFVAVLLGSCGSC